MSSSRFEKLTERARRVLSLAQEEAQRFNHNYIGTEHILLGLVRETEGVAARVLSNLGVELRKVRATVEFVLGKGEAPALEEIGLTSRAKLVLVLATDEMRRLNYSYTGTEHLLIGLIREGEGIAAGILLSLGVSLDKVRAETSLILRPAPTDDEKRRERLCRLLTQCLVDARALLEKDRAEQLTGGTAWENADYATLTNIAIALFAAQAAGE